MSHAQIAAFARTAKENDYAVRMIAGQKTRLARDAHDIRYDPIHDELLVTNPRALAVVIFRGGADGDEAPVRVIQGPKTQLMGFLGVGHMDRLEVDPVHNEIYVPVPKGLLVFPREANGDVAPIRIIQGPDTQLNATRAVAVDPVRNLIVVANSSTAIEDVGGPSKTVRTIPETRPGSMLIFNRTDNGNVKPRQVIGGPKTNLVRINQMWTHPPKGWIVATVPGVSEGYSYVGLWNITDNGDVPARWKLGGPNTTLKTPRAVHFSAAHKEIYVGDMRLNAILTYSFPEMF